MSMSEFDEELNKGNNEDFLLSTSGRVLPADFSADDIAFAEELTTLFSPEEEELPPYFVETLLESEDPRFVPFEHGLEYRTSARVFQRLNLRRRLFPSHPYTLGAIFTDIGNLGVHRPLVAMCAVLVLVMLMTVAFTSQQFTIGMALLLHGERAGAYPVAHYPDEIAAPLVADDSALASQHLSLIRTRQLLHFPMYSPRRMLDHYQFTGIYLYQQPNQTWVDGPVLELEYTLSSPTIPAGTGQIFIAEFKPRGDVLQLVPSGAAQTVQIDPNGDAKAIYVDGQWVPRNRLLPQWVSGQRSELIYQKDGVVFWIVGDQRDGIRANELWNIAQSLQVVDVSRMTHMATYMGYKTRIVQALPGPFTTDVLIVFPDDSGDTPYVQYVGSPQFDKMKVMAN